MKFLLGVWACDLEFPPLGLYTAAPNAGSEEDTGRRTMPQSDKGDPQAEALANGLLRTCSSSSALAHPLIYRTASTFLPKRSLTVHMHIPVVMTLKRADPPVYDTGRFG